MGITCRNWESLEHGLGSLLDDLRHRGIPNLGYYARSATPLPCQDSSCSDHARQHRRNHCPQNETVIQLPHNSCHGWQLCTIPPMSVTGQPSYACACEGVAKGAPDTACIMLITLTVDGWHALPVSFYSCHRQPTVSMHLLRAYGKAHSHTHDKVLCV
jgi:hypothetical protein